MREILFRGKIKDKWIYGLLSKFCGKYSITPFNDVGDTHERICVDNNTIGQYTGLLDKEGNKIFEGDIIKYKIDFDEEIAYIKYFYEEGYPAFDLSKNLDVDSNGLSYLINEPSCSLEVIGNIHDNPELIGE